MMPLRLLMSGKELHLREEAMSRIESSTQGDLQWEKP